MACNFGGRETSVTTIASVASYHPVLQVKKLSEGAVLPKKGTSGAAGYDLYSVEEKTLEPWSVTPLGTGIAIQLPKGTYGRVAPRSGLALKGIDVMAGVLDPDYTGEIKVILSNLSDSSLQVTKGMKIAQVVIEKCYEVEMTWADSLPITERGAKGFGSTD